jgi:hypothetical protein
LSHYFSCFFPHSVLKENFFLSGTSNSYIVNILYITDPWETVKTFSVFGSLCCSDHVIFIDLSLSILFPYSSLFYYKYTSELLFYFRYHIFQLQDFSFTLMIFFIF